MDQKKDSHINELAKEKSRGLTQKKRMEQAKLREVSKLSSSFVLHWGIKIVDEEGNDVTPETWSNVKKVYGRSLDDPNS